ncbi:aspartyl-phosphate phosphatase Spo0E family protein [Virgibacillus sp. 179-BFC.A HS]|uniref:Aspartyl-phosphate phosphatase Spo0E family protein n=1 Tax=Tigheibacillus jepli TaxID=3035914 RepID=A0ABU5CIA3_9BACI|nr:aspartyl-phosphate phosphatase Spo0E family protein [Virgibacillus sp. 179-BFC.A HS]MDY0406036.1 aspartyl-phosphate phosphatase Spo0E family protein [Virgibacillus sp. 179-BFC.A HS]
MIYAALTKGFTSKESVRLSQELDCLLNLYNHYSNVHCAMAEIEQGNHEYEMTDSSG